jgi:hypothetical protein
VSPADYGLKTVRNQLISFCVGSGSISSSLQIAITLINITVIKGVGIHHERSAVGRSSSPYSSARVENIWDIPVLIAPVLAVCQGCLAYNSSVHLVAS